MAPPPRYMQMVDASRDEAQLAVRLYNDPSEARSFEGFVVHMHLAWLYLLHAELTRAGVDFRYWRTEGRTRRLVRIDGEPKRWDLATCVLHRWPDEKDPVRANLVFFVRLRNKIEHRYARQQEALTAAVGGQAQALLLNYEEGDVPTHRVVPRLGRDVSHLADLWLHLVSSWYPPQRHDAAGARQSIRRPPAAVSVRPCSASRDRAGRTPAARARSGGQVMRRQARPSRAIRSSASGGPQVAA